MKKLLLGAALSALMTGSAFAANVGVSMALFDDNFLTVLRNGMIEYAKTLDGVNLQVEDAQNDVAKQQSQVQNFIASGVDAIIVNPVDTDATVALSKIAADAGIPLVYVNREPVNVNELQQKMEEEVQKDPTNQPELRIDANPDSEYEVMAKILAQAKNAQMKKIGFVQ